MYKKVSKKRTVLGTAKKKLKPSVEIEPALDQLEASPEFQAMREQMTEEFFAAEDPEFLEMMKRVTAQNE